MTIIMKLKGFINHGKLNTFDILIAELKKGRENLTEINCYLDLLTQEELERLLSQVWNELNPDSKRFLALKVYGKNYNKLIERFHLLEYLEKLKAIEFLAFISTKETVSFLLERVQSKNEGISWAAVAALKKHNPTLTLKPLLTALTQPDQWLPSRIVEVLRGIDKKILTTELLEISAQYPQSLYTVVDFLGELGEEQCLPLLANLANSSDYLLRKKVVEALKELKHPASADIFNGLLDDDKWQIRMAAAQGLGLIKNREARPFLQKRLSVENDQFTKEVIKEVLEKLEEIDEPQIDNWVRER